MHEILRVFEEIHMAHKLLKVLAAASPAVAVPSPSAALPPASSPVPAIEKGTQTAADSKGLSPATPGASVVQLNGNQVCMCPYRDMWGNIYYLPC
jgi:hypothetical protein